MVKKDPIFEIVLLYSHSKYGSIRKPDLNPDLAIIIPLGKPQKSSSTNVMSGPLRQKEDKKRLKKALVTIKLEGREGGGLRPNGLVISE